MSELAIYTTTWLSCAGFLITIPMTLNYCIDNSHSRVLGLVAALLWPVTWIVVGLRSIS